MKIIKASKNLIKKIANKITIDLMDWKKLLRSIPGLVTTLFIVSVVVMNLMAAKVIILLPYFGITGGLLLSWIPFLTMDIVVKTYGVKAANKLTILGLIINLACVGIFQLVSSVQIGGDETQYQAFNATFSQTWQILIASSIAFLISGIINNFTNILVGKLFSKNPDGKLAYVVRTYVSTMIGQFVDNFIFLGLAFLVFFNLSVGSTMGYTIQNVIGTAILGALIELVMEIVFSPIGYRLCKKWQNENVGLDYQEFQNEIACEEEQINYGV